MKRIIGTGSSHPPIPTSWQTEDRRFALGILSELDEMTERIFQITRRLAVLEKEVHDGTERNA